MTRFARAEGSKASNKKTYEDATPWQDLKKGMKSTKTKVKKRSKTPPKVEGISASRKIGTLSPAKNTKKELTKAGGVNGKTKKEGKDQVNGKTKKDGKDQVNGKTKKETKKDGKDQGSVVEDGVKYKIFKNGKKKPWFNLPYEENDIMIKYNKFFVKRTAVPELDLFRKSLEKQNLGEKEIANKMLHQERKVHHQLRLELLRGEIAKSDLTVSKNLKRRVNHGADEKSAEQIQNQNGISKTQLPKNRQMDLNSVKYEENEVMTKFEGYWILKKNVRQMELIKKLKIERIMNKRPAGNTDENLTADEELEYRRLMKKEKRRETRLLKLELIHMMKRNRSFPSTPFKPQKGKPGKYLGINYEEGETMAKFDGYYVTREGAERLNKLRDDLTSKGASKEKVYRVLKNERRKEERSLKNDAKVHCYKCRQVGHTITSCPQTAKEGLADVQVCFRCGSAEHMARNCPANKESYSYATCFICNETGHISRECPDNPKGLYPNGGCCNECGSVEHMKRDCPEFRERFEEDVLKVSSYKRGQEIDALDEEEEPSMYSSRPSKKPKSQHIVFD